MAELQHIGRASQQLHRTQPALTSCVRRLEEACGAPLFEKSGRGIRLTPAGRILQKWAQRMRFDVEDAKREIGDIGRGLSGQVRIGVVPTAAQFLLPTVSRQLLAEAPGVTMKTVVGLVDVLRPLLKAGELDLIVATETPGEPGFESRLLAEDSIVVAASATHPIFDKPAVRMSDLTACHWVLQPPGAPTRDWLDHAFDRARLPRPVVQIESSMLVMLPPLIAETGLLSFVSRHHVGDGTSLREVVLKETTMRRRMTVSYRADSYLLPVAQRLIELFASFKDGEFNPDASSRRVAGRTERGTRKRSSAA
jgi:DNA-binding transcriptional LysR family regulator